MNWNISRRAMLHGTDAALAPGTPMPNLHLSLLQPFRIQQETFGAGNGILENL
jgi:hypothetical protein